MLLVVVPVSCTEGEWKQAKAAPPHSLLPFLSSSFLILSLSPPSVWCSQIYCIENAHGQLVRDLDFNPNRQYYLASCGDDCKVKFWDVRNVQEPVKTLEEHSHW